MEDTETDRAKRTKREPYKPTGHIVSNPGQGDCFYFVLSQALARLNPNKLRTHRQIRAWLHTYMKNKIEVFRPAWDGQNARGSCTVDTFEAYLQQQQKTGTWATTLEVKAAAMGLRQRIYAIDDNSVTLVNEEAADGYIAIHYADNHFEFLADSDEAELRDHRGFASKEHVLRAGGKAKSSVASVPNLSDFASPTPRSKMLHTKTSSVKLTQFAKSKSTKASSVKKCASSLRSASRNFEDSTSLGTRAKDDRSLHWVCDVCNRKIASSDGRKLARLRWAHIHKQHPGVPREHTMLRTVTTVPTQPERHLRGKAQWQCAWCRECLPWLDNSTRIASIRSHLKHCTVAPAGATRGTNQTKLLKEAGVPSKLKSKSAGGRSRQISSHGRWATLVQSAAQHGHALVKPRLEDTERSPDIACAKCFQGRCTIGKAESFFTKPCAAQDRKYNLIRAIACRWKRANASKRARMRKVLKLTPTEVVTLKKLPQPALSAKHPWAWKKDLTEDGDIHPQPGPRLVCASVNMQGRENAYRLFDYAAKTDVVLLQETNMDAHESQQFQAYAAKHGYRAWSTEGRTLRDTMGRRIARGGIVTLVKQTLKADLFHRHPDVKGDIIAINIGTLLLANVYQTHAGLDQGGLRLDLQDLQSSVL